jgi:hypothetical protein
LTELQLTGSFRPFMADTLAVFGAVAQLGERLVRNEEVRGSIPLSSMVKGYWLWAIGYWLSREGPALFQEILHVRGVANS